MAFPFPLNPVDGQVVTQTQPDGSVLTATYNQSKNEWVIDRQQPAPTPITGTPPINVTASADGQVITWDKVLGTWVAKAPAASGGVGGTYVKGTQAAPDTTNPPNPGGKPLVAGMLQSTLENLHKEIKAWNGTAWTEVFGEDTIKQWISAGSLFRGVVKEATLSTLPAPATANRGFYYSWTGNPGYVVKAADPGIGTDLVGEILQVGDWVQSDGAKWVHVPGDLLSKQRWDSLGSFTSWSDTSWEKGSVVSYQKAFFRANALISPGDLPPGDPGSKWTDITPLPHMKLEELEDCLNLGSATDMQVPAWDAINSEWVPTQLALNDLSDVNADVTDPTSNGAVFQWDLATQQWVAANTLALRLEDLGDTGPLSGATKGQVPTWDDTNSEWAPKTLGLKDLGDAASLSSASDGQVPTWNNTTKQWFPSHPPDELNDLTDVRLSALADGQVLKFDLTANEWHNSTVDGYTKAQIDTKISTLVVGFAHGVAAQSIVQDPPTAPVADELYIVGTLPTGLFATHANELAVWDGTKWTFSAAQPNEAHLVEDQSATYGWSGTAWVKVASAVSGGTSAQAGVGEIVPWIGNTFPTTDYLECKGQVVAIPTYVDLHNAIGNKYNAGTPADGTSTFALPDLRGYFLRGDKTGLTAGTAHPWTTGLPKAGFGTNNTGDHTHGFKRSTNNFSGDGKYRDGNLSTIQATSGGETVAAGIMASGAHSHTVTGGDTETAPDHFVVKWLIRYKPINGGATGAAGPKGDATPLGEVWQVGSIQQSMLTEPQWATLLGPVEGAKWVLADGRNCTGTKFGQITGKTNLPDLRGAFLRSAGQNRNGYNRWNGGDVGQWYEDSTALPKTAFTTSSSGAHTHTANPEGYYASKSSSGTWAIGSPVVHDGQDGRMTLSTSTAGAHTHTIGGGDIQTAPVHVAVNTFIKIN
jgi:microcystin-dependent protein